MSGPVVSNTTPLSTLARVGCLGWIPKRRGRVTIPGAVWREFGFLRDTAALERLRSEGGLYLSDAFIDQVAEESDRTEN
jgi:predicted nucleic acid-binding protein